MHDIYQEIERIEAEYAKGKIDLESLVHYRWLTFQVIEPKRFFDTIIKYELYKNLETQSLFFYACRKYGQKKIYDLYMPNSFSNVIKELLDKKAPYSLWEKAISYWQSLNTTASINRQSHQLALNFLATTITLDFNPYKQYLLQDFKKHPIYKNILAISTEFFRRPDMSHIDDIQQQCFEHIIKLRQECNFNDPWVNFYSDFLNSQEYKEFVKPYHEYMDSNNIEYKNKLVFCLLSGSFSKDTNVGDMFKYTQCIIHWSLHHHIPLIALLTPFQQEWLGIYFKDYFDHIITLDSNANIPSMMKYLYPDAGRFVSVNVGCENIPYYLPRTYKFHFNHYTNMDLHNPDTDAGELLAVNIPYNIKKDISLLIKKHQFKPKKTILIAHSSNSMDGLVMSNKILKEFWIMLAYRLKEEGFTPIINLSKTDEEHYFDDCVCICLPLSHIVEFVNNICGFVGARSGLCDLLCATNENVKKYSVTPIEFIDWGNDLVPYFYEVKFTFDNMQQHIDDIVDSLNGKNVKAFENQQHYGYLTFPDFS